MITRLLAAALAFTMTLAPGTAFAQQRQEEPPAPTVNEQESAEAARPYAERMGRVLANIAASAAGQAGAPALIAGTGVRKTNGCSIL